MSDPRTERCRQIVLACITACAKARDERGRWRAEKRCTEQLHTLAPVGNATIDAACSAAARRLGSWLARQGV